MPIPTHRTVSTLEPDDITLHRRLMRLRRRARTILLARYLLVALCLAVAAGSVALLWPIAVPAVAWTAALVVAGVSVVALVVLRTPDTRDVAASVDRRLHLADATVMALSLRGSRDPIARLIVRDTIARMTGERMAGVFPFELGRPAISVVGAAVVCVVVMAGLNRWPQASMFSPGGGMRIASPGGQTPQGQRSPGAVEGSDDHAGSETATASQAEPATTSAKADASLPKADTARDGLADSQTDRPLALGSSEASRAASNAGRPDAPQTGASPRGQAARTGGPGGSGADEAAGTASGGTQRGRLQADTAAAAPPPAEYGAAYRTARTRVDTAIARDEIPRSRRAYVRDYFLAIAPRD